MATINTEAISIPINFPCPGVSCLNIIECQIIKSTGYSQKSNIHGYPITGINRSIISGVMSGAFLFQRFKYTGVEEYQISGNNIIVMSSPLKVIVCHIIQVSGVVVSGQGSRCPVNVLVPHESMSYTEYRSRCQV